MAWSKFNSCFSSILITVVTFTTPGRRYVMPAAKDPGCFRNIEFKIYPRGHIRLGVQK